MSLLRRGCFKWICYLFIAVVIMEVVVFNAIVLVAFLSVKKKMDGIWNGKESTFLENIVASKQFENWLYSAKSGGLVKIIQETVGRMYVIQYPHSNARHMEGAPSISGIGFDTSNSGESMYLYRRIQAREEFPYSKLIVDIGANDGLISSNSFNFLEWGWNAILVEPQASELNLAILNNRHHKDPYNEGKQELTVFQGVLAEKDGFTSFVISSSVDRMESHVMTDSDKEFAENPDPLIIEVPSLTVRSFTAKYKVPKKFGILSIDAEGLGDKILQQWMKLGFRPAYIVYEHLHNSGSIEEIASYLEKCDYRYVSLLGWNHIFEHVPFPGDDQPSGLEEHH